MDKIIIIRSFNGDLSAEEKNELDDWLNSSETHRKEYEVLRNFWDEPKQLREVPQEEIWTKITTFISNDSQIKYPRRKNNNWVQTNWLRYASAAAILLFFSWFIFLQFNTDDETPTKSIEVKFVEKTNPAGRKSQIKLPDGSVVHLNANSKLSIVKPFFNNYREVYLSGEAFFDVKKDTAHPFIIHTGEVDITVKGTSFNVSAFEMNDHIAVTVASGIVAVRANSKEKVLLVEANEKASFNKENKKLQSVSFSKDDWAWKEGKLLFKDASLDEVIKTLENWYGVKVETLEGLVLKNGINGEFLNENLENVLEGICYTANLSYELQGKRVTLKAK